jgi:putative protease
MTASPAPITDIELLAPAGTLTAFAAAFEAGADAVYVGAPGLNARALARDFTFAEIAAMTRHAHDLGKRLYVAMNSLVKESELRLALENLEAFSRIGPDALIIQDLGLLHLARRFFPDLQLHASTLMTAGNSLAAAWFGSLGFRRVVLARELSLVEIRAIGARSGVDLEVFIHGAMCFSYSGLCRFSSLHGGKSSLRGQCVQPCRRRYGWLPSGKRATSAGGRDGGYLFSMNDLSGIDHLAEARDAGVVSLKIEGRLKSVEYVRSTVRAYRLALDALNAEPQQRERLLAEAQSCLDESMGRKRSAGFFTAGTQDRLIVPQLSGNTGEVIGRVAQLETSKGGRVRGAAAVRVELKASVRIGDRLRLYDQRSDGRWSFTLRRLEAGGRPVEQARSGQTVRIPLIGVELSGLRQPFSGLLFRVDVAGRTGAGRQVQRVKSIRFAPAKSTAIDRLLAELNPAERGDKKGSRRVSTNAPAAQPQWWVRIPGPELIVPRLPFTVARLLVDCSRRNVEQYLAGRCRARNRQAPFVWALPPVIAEERLAWHAEAISRLHQAGERAFQVGHISQIGLFAGLGGDPAAAGFELAGDYSLNMVNSPALQEGARQGLAGVQFSLETDRPTLRAALDAFALASPAGQARMRVGMLVYGRPPLFTARLDAPHFQGQRSLVSSRGERYYLDREEEALFVRPHQAFSLLQHVADLTRAGVNYFVVDVSQGQLKRECAEVTALLSGRGALPEVFSGNYDGILA